MAKKLTRAVKAWVYEAYGADDPTWLACTDRLVLDAKPCYIVPAAEYERLARKSTKAAKRGRRGK